MYSNNLEGRQGSDLIQYSAPWEYKLTNKQEIRDQSGLNSLTVNISCIQLVSENIYI